MQGNSPADPAHDTHEGPRRSPFAQQQIVRKLCNTLSVCMIRFLINSPHRMSSYEVVR